MVNLLDSHIEYITWEDAYSSDEWVDGVEKVEPFIVHTIGYLIYEDDKRITLAGSVQEYSTSCRLIIPKGMIITRIRLGIPQNDIPDNLTEEIVNL